MEHKSCNIRPKKIGIYLILKINLKIKKMLSIVIFSKIKFMRNRYTYI